MYQVGKKFDEHILNYDWDDPFVQCNEPCCNRPNCHMKYVEPCKRRCNDSCGTCGECGTTYYETAPAPCGSCGSR
jgi:hypothetical protein